MDHDPVGPAWIRDRGRRRHGGGLPGNAVRRPGGDRHRSGLRDRARHRAEVCRGRREGRGGGLAPRPRGRGHRRDHHHRRKRPVRARGCELPARCGRLRRAGRLRAWAGRRPCQQRSDRRGRRRAADGRGHLGPRCGGGAQERLPLLQGGAAFDDRAAHRFDREHLLGQRDHRPRQRGLQRGQGRHDQPDPGNRRALRRPWDPVQRDRAGHHPYPYLAGAHRPRSSRVPAAAQVVPPRACGRAR